MEITRQIHARDPDGTAGPDQTITIRVRPEDDPYGVINGLVLRGRLEALLRVLAAGDDLGGATTPEEARELLTGHAWVAQRADVELERLMWACRDTLGMSWRQIAAAADVDFSTVRRRVARMRQTEADHGRWRTPAGLHRGTLAEARAALAAAAGGDNAADTTE